MKPRATALLFAILLALASSVHAFEAGAPYYFDHFEPSQKPWHPGQDLNFEEVFKNYQFFEIVFDASGKELTVNHYIQNRKTSSEQYRIGADGALRRK